MTEKRSRRRGKGSLQKYQTNTGTRWRYQIWVPNDPEFPDNGQTKYSRAGFLTDDDADDAMQKALQKRREQKSFASKVPTIEKYVQTWLDSLRLEGSTIDSYRRIARNHITPHIGHLPLNKLTPTRIAALYRELEQSGRKDRHGYGKGLSANSVNKVHIALGSLLESALDDGHISSNPTKKKRTVKAPKGAEIRANKPEIKTWDAAQLHSFLEWNKNTYQDELFPLWRLIVFTGMRRSESLALQWQDINQKTGLVSLRRSVNIYDKTQTKVPKTGNARALLIDPETLNALKVYKSLRGLIALDLIRPTAFIFGAVDGSLRNPDKISRRWTTVMKNATAAMPDLPRITIRELRHTHATVLLELGEHPKIVQERLGHSTISTTMNTYSHVTPTMQQNAIARLAKHVDG